MISNFQEKKFSKKYRLIAGIDEAGRGCWAGPVVVGCVVFDSQAFKNEKLKEINDSKKLTPQKREKLFELICQNCLEWKIGIVFEKEIDNIGILNATIMAIKKAINDFSLKPDFLLMDALSNSKKNLSFGIPYQTFVKGDEKIFSIAAASILAKVSRDKILKEMAIKYPQYGFEKHKGYGTALHLNALKKYGICEIHRKTFKPIKNLIFNL
ncbi:MAG: ribonuclease HII [Patescibacteria group bacterium]